MQYPVDVCSHFEEAHPIEALEYGQSVFRTVAVLAKIKMNMQRNFLYFWNYDFFSILLDLFNRHVK